MAQQNQYTSDTILITLEEKQIIKELLVVSEQIIPFVGLAKKVIRSRDYYHQIKRFIQCLSKRTHAIYQMLQRQPQQFVLKDEFPQEDNWKISSMANEDTDKAELLRQIQKLVQQLKHQSEINTALKHQLGLNHEKARINQYHQQSADQQFSSQRHRSKIQGPEEFDCKVSFQSQQDIQIDDYLMSLSSQYNSSDFQIQVNYRVQRHQRPKYRDQGYKV